MNLNIYSNKICAFEIIFREFSWILHFEICDYKEDICTSLFVSSFIFTIVLQESKPAFFSIDLSLTIFGLIVDFSSVQALFFLLIAPL